MSVDPSSITAAVVSDLIKVSFISAAEGASRSIKSSWQKIFEDFSPYMEETFRRNRNVRILCQKEKDVDLYDVYVNSNFNCGHERFDDEKIVQSVIEGKNIIVNGNGGAGKTFFMRHLWLAIFANGGPKIPIFLELRQLNDLTTLNLKTFIRATIANKSGLSEDVFDFFCENGRFIFLLDGFDEVVQSQRDSLQRQIIDIASKFPQCSVAVSSRYEKRFAGWQNFDLFESRPFDLKQVKQLIRKVPFDEGSKKLFLKKLNITFFRENQSFLSNPLLAIMMMMTFRENMDIPKRMNIFYDQAFNTLYQWHDATKAYSREKTLDIDEFQKSFGMFCLLSYYRQSYEFTKSEIVEYIAMSNKVCGYGNDPESILKDYEESVNLIRQDGLKYVFIHRSFQEYFAARALVSIVPDKFHEFIPEISRRANDSVLSMCFEMNRRIVSKHFISSRYADMSELGIFERRQNPFATLAAMSVVYGFSVAYEAQSTRSRALRGAIVGISINMEPSVAEFIENVVRLMGDRSSQPIFYTQEMLFEDAFFDIFRPMKRAEVGFVHANVTVSFTNGMPSANVELDPVEDGVDLTEFRKQIDNEIASSSPHFERVARRVVDRLSKIRAWCENELEQSEQRGRSLDEILGF